MIDLHMHTTASDGRLTPAELVERAAAAGLKTIAVTDHDTIASIADVKAAAEQKSIRVVNGIEITAVDHGRDVHMLGYFFDPASKPLAALLLSQRALRVMRVREIATTLAKLNMPIDVESVLLASAARPGSSIGRPQIAREMLRAGHVKSVQEAFDQWLATGKPAYEPRMGPRPAEVIDTVHQAGGLASFAHPGVTRRDELIAPLVERGLDAIEVYHSDHTPDDVIAYRGMAVRLGVLISGGSDFHGDEDQPEPASAKAAGRRASRSIFGAVTLPAADFDALEKKTRH
jgi:hypothetical protein